MSADDASQERLVLEARIADDSARLAELSARHKAVCAWTGDRRPRELKIIERQIRETTKHKTEHEQRLHQIGNAPPLPRDSSDLLKLPAGFRSSGDPIEGNPFPDSNLRHRVWDDATRRAEEKWCRFNSASEDYSDRPEVLIDSVCKRIAGRFDIWAERGVHVVWSDGDLRGYEQWLVNYAEAWLRDVGAKKLYSLVVPLHGLLAALRLALTKRVNWWRAEARRYLAEQEADLAEEKIPPTKPKKGRPPNKLVASRRTVIQGVAAKGLKGKAYCEALDKAALSTPIQWQKNESCPKKYLEAFNHADRNLRTKWRNRIANEKYLYTTRIKSALIASEHRPYPVAPA